MGDWIFDHFGWVVGGLVALTTVAFIASSAEEMKHKQTFMAECVKDHKQYECDVLWSQATQKSTDSSSMATGIAVGLAAGMAGRR
jgi:hypothetical protein